MFGVGRWHRWVMVWTLDAIAGFLHILGDSHIPMSMPYVRCQYVELLYYGGIVVFVRLSAASIAPELVRLLIHMQLPLVGQAHILPKYIRRMSVEFLGDERNVLEGGGIEIGDHELE
jgi:hypothetical protein